MRGVILSFDALIGLAMLFFVILTVNANLAHIEENPFSASHLRESALDAATVLEKSGDLAWTLKHNDSTHLRRFLNQLPQSLCMDVQLFNSLDINTTQVLVARDGCEAAESETVAVSRTFLVYDGADMNYFVARVDAWRQGT